MKRFSLAVLSVSLLAACGDAGQPLAPSAGPAAPRLAASTTITNESFPLSAFTFVPCANGGAGENVEFAGDLHIISRVTQSASGNFSITFHENPLGMHGTGVVTGDTYQVTGAGNQTMTLGPGQTETFISQFPVIGPGPDNNLKLHTTTHVTVNANGEVTSVVDNTSATCG